MKRLGLLVDMAFHAKDGRNAADTLRQNIATAAMAWEGRPFKHQGRVKAGIDCIGLVVEVCRELQLKAPDGTLLADYDVKGYSREPAKGLLQSHLEKLLLPVQGAYQLGDVLLFTFVKYPQHCGIITRISEEQEAGTGRSREPSASEATPIAEVRRPEQGQQIIFTHASQPAKKVITSRIDTRWRKLLVGHYRFNEVS